MNEDRRYLYNYIKREINDMNYIQQYIKLKKTGLVYKGICPFHKEKTASFTVYPPGYMNKNSKQDNMSFYCFGCGVTGDIIKFKQLKDNLNSYYDAAVQLAIEYKLNIEDDNNIKINYLQSKILDIEDNILDLDKINLTCSTIIRNYIRKNQNKEAFKKAEEYFKYLDNELNERNAIECQDLIEETIKKFEI